MRHKKLIDMCESTGQNVTDKTKYIYISYIYIWKKRRREYADFWGQNTSPEKFQKPQNTNCKHCWHEAHSIFFLLKWGKSCRRFRGVKRTVTHTEKLPRSVRETNSAPLSEGKVGGAGGSKTQIHTKVENPPALPMEAYLESQWPPLHRFHNWYWHFWKNRKSLWVNCLTKNLRFAQVQTNKETTAHRQKTPERKAQKNPGAKPSN